MKIVFATFPSFSFSTTLWTVIKNETNLQDLRFLQIFIIGLFMIEEKKRDKKQMKTN